MNVQVRGWFTGPLRARVRVLTADAEREPNAENIARTLLEECCWNEASVGPDFSTFTVRDLAEDMTVPASERPYRYYEVMSETPA